MKEPKIIPPQKSNFQLDIEMPARENASDPAFAYADAADDIHDCRRRVSKEANNSRSEIITETFIDVAGSSAALAKDFAAESGDNGEAGNTESYLDETDNCGNCVFNNKNSAEIKKEKATAKIKTVTIIRAAVIAALYITLTLAFMPISFGGTQFRVSECLAILPLFFPESIIGLTVGCIISNFFGNGILDVVIGSLCTLAASTATFFIGRTKMRPAVKLILGVLPPIVINAFFVPFTYLLLTELKALYWLEVLLVGVGQTGVMCTLGIPLFYGLRGASKLIVRRRH